jgi:hypothetical protein
MICTVSQVYFDKELKMSSNLILLADGNITSMTNTYCCVYSVETPDDGQ